MSPLQILIIVLVALALVAVMFFVAMYNKLVGLRNRFKNAYAQIDVQLKQRYDLIPNLVETAKGYLKHERGTLEAVIADTRDCPISPIVLIPESQIQTRHGIT